MGKVASGTAVDLFLAEDQKSGARVLVEALRPELIQRSDLIGAVVHHAKLREGLEHPNISRRLRSVTSAEGRHHWLSEPLQGDTLRSHLATFGPLGARDAIRVLLELCEAVAYLHQYGYTHGNLSPEYVVFDAQQLKPKLLDTGLSLYRFEGVAPSLGTRVLVRPEYLSPERIQGQRADALSDVYALGALLHEMVTGAPPYTDRDLNAVRQRHLRDPIPTLPGDLKVLQPILSGCLAKVRSARFPRIEVLQAALLDAKARPATRTTLPLDAPAPVRTTPIDGAESTPPPRTEGPEVSLDAHFPSRRAVLSASSARGSKLTLFVPTPQKVRQGAPVRLSVSLGDSHRLFELTGTALSDSVGPRGPRMSGFTVGFFGNDKKRASEMLAFCADRPPAMGTAGCRRFPVAVTCKLKAVSGRAEGHVMDLSRTGAFVTTVDPQRLASVTAVQLRLNPRLLGLVGSWVEGEVVWRGRKGGRYGVGVRFVGDNSDVVEVLDRYALKTRSPKR